jgi:hypothetical protein
MWTLAYWKQVAERMIKAGAAALLSAWVVGDGVLDAWKLDPKEGAGIALGGMIVSLLLSLASAPFGEPGTPSLVPTPAASTVDPDYRTP